MNTKNTISTDISSIFSEDLIGAKTYTKRTETSPLIALNYGLPPKASPIHDFRNSRDYIGFHLFIEGNSRFDGASGFYKQFSDEFKKLAGENRLATVNVALEYFNANTSGALLHLFRSIQEGSHEYALEHLPRRYNHYVVSGNPTIMWYSKEGDKNHINAGEDFESIINLPFKFVSVDKFSKYLGK